MGKNREFKGSMGSMGNRESKGSKGNRESEELRENRKSEELRENRKSGESKEFREKKESNKSKESRDLTEKEFESFPDVAADLINVLMYDGEQVVREENLVPAPTESIYRGKERLRNQYQDLANYEMLGRRINALYQFANQSGPDSRMVLRTAGYTGAVYREQYEGKSRGCFPVMELVLYWGKKPWGNGGSLHRLFRKRSLSPKAWQYIDDLKIHVWEMRRLPAQIREKFESDMRIVLDYLAEGDGYRSDRKVVHKEAVIRMIRALSGETYLEDTAQIMEKCEIREEDEITVCELFDQYWRGGLQEGLQKGRREGHEEGRIEGCQEGWDKALLSSVRALMENLSLTAEQAMKALNVSESQWRDYLARL